MALQWTSALAVGVPALDAQHQELFRRLDRLLDAMLHQDRSEAGRLLDFLRRYAVEHLGAEERLMVELAYPDRAHHQEEHRHFAAMLQAIDLAFQADGPTPALVLHLEQQVLGWIHDHVYFTDVALGRFLRARQPSSTARAAW